MREGNKIHFQHSLESDLGNNIYYCFPVYDRYGTGVYNEHASQIAGNYADI